MRPAIFVLAVRRRDGDSVRRHSVAPHAEHGRKSSARTERCVRTADLDIKHPAAIQCCARVECVAPNPHADQTPETHDDAEHAAAAQRVTVSQTCASGALFARIGTPGDRYSEPCRRMRMWPVIKRRKVAAQPHTWTRCLGEACICTSLDVRSGGAPSTHGRPRYVQIVVAST
jgi:uncharacterized Fe-S cluster protein YjdI